MTNSRILILATVLIVASMCGGYLLIIEDDDTTDRVLYYDDEMLLREQICDSSAILMDIDGSLTSDRTFFGWSTSREGATAIMHPGEEIDVDGEMRLYAVMADGNISCIDGTVDFDHAGPVGDLIIDLRHIQHVDVLRISAATLDAMGGLEKEITIFLTDGTAINFDRETTRDMLGIVDDGPLEMAFDRFENGMDMRISSSSDVLEEITGKISISISRTTSYGPRTVVFEGSVSNGNEVDAIQSQGNIAFEMGSFGYRILEVFDVEVRQSNGDKIEKGHPDYPEIGSGSVCFEIWGMFAKDDSFTLPDPGEGRSYSVISGATRGPSEENIVSGKSSIIIELGHSERINRIILPSQQIGYIITSDISEVPDGGRCVIQYLLRTGYVDEDLVITLNGENAELDGMSRIIIEDIRSDIVVEVSGVYDARVFDVILPEYQEGYEMISSSNNVNYGSSYSLGFRLLPDYEKGSNFKVEINGETVDISSGTLEVEGVVSTQSIYVTGVQLRTFEISSGEHVTLKVDGYVSTMATCRDLVKLSVDDGYMLPSNYRDYLPITVHPNGSGYTISGDSYFPGVSSITTGENIVIEGHEAETSFFACSSERFTILPDDGYSLPSNYGSAISAMDGVNVDDGRYRFDSDVSLPSIYKVTYLGYSSSIFDIKYFISGDTISIPDNKPSKVAFIFEGWNIYSNTVESDIKINSKWSPISYNVTFGPNLTVKIKDSDQTKTILTKNNEVETIVWSNQEITLFFDNRALTPLNYIIPFNAEYNSGHYSVIGDSNFLGLSIIQYLSEGGNSVVYDYAVISSTYHLKSESISEKTGHTFKGWNYCGNVIDYIPYVENLTYTLVEIWEPVT